MAFTETFVLIIMVIIIIGYVRQQYAEVDIVEAHDNRKYIVRRMPDAKEAAERLARVNKHMHNIVHHMLAKHPSDESVLRLYNNFNPDAISEGGAEVGYTSYSVNKGEKIVLCIRQSNGQFVDHNVIMYVAIHELAHLMTKEIGHPTVFWDNFKRLLQEAIDLKIYTKTDFARSPTPYCGITITSSVI
jgi:hypothetical protein